MKLIYILSTGHSGSTVLGSLLGNGRDAIHLGEFANFHKVYANQLETCSCGYLPQNCSFWGKIIFEYSNFLDSIGNNLEYYERTRKKVESTVLKGKTLELDFEDYKLLTIKLFDIISITSRRSFIIDSSKSPARAYALSKVFHKNFIIILLRRNLKDVISSFLRKRGKISVFLFVKGVIKEHLKFVYAIRKARSNSIRLTYEDMFSLKKMERLMYELGVEDPIDLKGKIHNEHVIAGNRLRYQSTFHLKKSQGIHRNFSLLEESSRFRSLIPSESYSDASTYVPSRGD